MPTPKRRLPPKRAKTVELGEQLLALNEETLAGLRFGRYLPEAWNEVLETPVPGRTRITLRVDQDVAKFFRALGPGYQRTMNRVLRVFMLARLTEMVEGPEHRARAWEEMAPWERGEAPPPPEGSWAEDWDEEP